ncbi:MAG: transporter substrate-binding protein [Hyphomicrobiales bacterium]|nr:transporter substrate-binding protein [Hyphomicrobiales bacterium]
MKQTFTRRGMAATVALAFGIWSSPMAANVVAAEPLSVRIAWSTTPTEMMPILFEKKEILKHFGKSYVAEMVRVRGSGPQITAMAAGALEVGTLAPNTFVLAIQNAQLDDLKVVADSGRDGHEDYFSSEYVVLPDSPIKTVKDLKGKVLATNGIGGATDMGLRKLLRDAGLDDKKDVKIVEVEFPNMEAALAEKRIDMASMALPFAYTAKKNGHVRVLARMKDSMGPNEKNFLVIRGGFIAAHRAALVDLFEDMLIATKWFLDPKNRTEALEIIARYNKAPVAGFSEWTFTKEDTYHPTDMKPDLEMLQRNIVTLLNLGYLKANIDVQAHSDMTLLQDAEARLN